MSNNTFDIEVGAFIPTEMTPGKIYINALRYTNKVPYGDNGSFLLVSKPKSYLGAGVTKEVVACVSNENRVDSNKIYVTPGHPGYTIAEPLDSTRYYLDSNKNILYKPVENPRVNGYRNLEFLKEQEVVYQPGSTEPYVYVYGDYMETIEIESIPILFDTLSTSESEEEASQSLPLSVVVVHSEEELHSLTPSFLGVYKVVHADGTFTAYIYNPYEKVAQDYFSFNCDVFY